MANYILQTLGLAGLCAFFSLRRQTLDLYLVSLISVWSIGTILIYSKFGMAQHLFYTNDQAGYESLVNSIGEFGVSFRLHDLIGGGYPVVVPAFLLTLFGINTVLTLKFIQLVSLILIYKSGRAILAREGQHLVPWQIIFFCGPIFVFMSLLGLRDLALSYFTLMFVFKPSPASKGIGIICVFMLRPHLGAALFVGKLVSMIYRRVQFKHFHIMILCVTLSLYFVGAYAFRFGSTFQFGESGITTNEVLSQAKFTRLGANFLGLQFLVLGDAVKLSVVTLFATRILFIDTFLIPIIFLITMVIPSKRWNDLRIEIFSGFIFFYGVTSQTMFNSTRQNIPFLLIMGIASLIGSPILNRRVSSGRGVESRTQINSQNSVL